MKRIILLLLIIGFKESIFGQMTSNSNTNTSAGLRIKHSSFEIIQKHNYKGTQEINRIELNYRDLNFGFFLEIQPAGFNYVSCSSIENLSNDNFQSYYPNSGYSKIGFVGASSTGHFNASANFQTIYLGRGNKIFPFGFYGEIKNYFLTGINSVSVTDKISSLYQSNNNYDYKEYEKVITTNFQKYSATLTTKKIGAHFGIYNYMNRFRLSGHLSLNNILHSIDKTENSNVFNSNVNSFWVLSPGVQIDKGNFSSYAQVNLGSLMFFQDNTIENSMSSSNSLYFKFVYSIPLGDRIRIGVQSENFIEWYKAKESLLSIYQRNIAQDDITQSFSIFGIQGYAKLQF
jgi:hypothetical protein